MPTFSRPDDSAKEFGPIPGFETITLPKSQKWLLAFIAILWISAITSGLPLIVGNDSGAAFIHVLLNVLLGVAIGAYILLHLTYLKRSGRVGPHYAPVRSSGWRLLVVYAATVLTGLLSAQLEAGDATVAVGSIHAVIAFIAVAIVVSHAGTARQIRGD